jgi:hypothetical protein
VLVPVTLELPMWALPSRSPITSEGSIAPNRPEIVTDINTSTVRRQRPEIPDCLVSRPRA